MHYLQKILASFSIIAVMFFFIPIPQAQAAGIGFNVITNHGRATANPVSFTHTSTAGSNFLAIICVDDPSGDGIASNAVTFGGTTATFVGKGNRGDGRFAYLYMLQAAGSGAQTVSVANPSTHNIDVSSVTYTGTAQTGQPDSTPAASTWVTQTSKSYAYTTVADNSWLVACVDNGSTITAGANTAVRGADEDPRATDSNSDQTPAGAHSLAWTFSSASGIAIGVSIAPAATTASFNFWQFFAF